MPAASTKSVGFIIYKFILFASYKVIHSSQKKQHSILWIRGKGPSEKYQQGGKVEAEALGFDAVAANLPGGEVHGVVGKDAVEV